MSDLPFRVTCSKETDKNKAVCVTESNARSYWSPGGAGTATSKEWLLFELEEPALICGLCVTNRSVSEVCCLGGPTHRSQAPHTHASHRPVSSSVLHPCFALR